jgi:hypothetical protein
MDEVTTGDFVVGQVLGEGRFATVFHARLKKATRKAGRQNRNHESSSVAIKVIEKTTLGKNEGILSAVLQERFRFIARRSPFSVLCCAAPGQLPRRPVRVHGDGMRKRDGG